MAFNTLVDPSSTCPTSLPTTWTLTGIENTDPLNFSTRYYSDGYKVTSRMVMDTAPTQNTQVGTCAVNMVDGESDHRYTGIICHVV